MWPFSTNKREKKREEDRRIKIAASQLALLEAATTTADTAQTVTNKMRQRLEDSVQQFESTARLITDALIVCDSSGQVNAFNPAAETIFAIPAAEIEMASVSRLFLYMNQTVENIDLLWKYIENGEDEGENAVLRGCRGNGETFAIDASLTRLGRHDGSTLILLLIRDLSDLFADRHIAEVHAQRFQSLFNLSFDGILIIQNSRIVAANKAAAQTFGVEPTTLLSMPPDRLFEGAIPVLPTETDGTRSDGTSVRLLFSSTGITWNSSKAHLVTVKDVSELRQLRDAIQNSDNGQDMICVFDADFKITFANSCFVDYYRCPHPVGKDIRDLLPECDRDTFSLKMRSLTQTNTTFRNQVQHTSETGELRLLDWIDHAVFDETGAVVEYQRTGKDITSVLKNLMTKDR